MAILHKLVKTPIYYSIPYKKPRRTSCHKRKIEKKAHEIVYEGIYNLIAKTKMTWNPSRIRKMACKLKDTLYYLSRTLEEYANISTLQARVIKLVKMIINREILKMTEVAAPCDDSHIAGLFSKLLI